MFIHLTVAVDLQHEQWLHNLLLHSSSYICVCPVHAYACLYSDNFRSGCRWTNSHLRGTSSVVMGITDIILAPPVCVVDRTCTIFPSRSDSAVSVFSAQRVQCLTVCSHVQTHYDQIFVKGDCVLRSLPFPFDGKGELSALNVELRN